MRKRRSSWGGVAAALVLMLASAAFCLGGEVAPEHGRELEIVRVPGVRGGAMAAELVGRDLYVLSMKQLHIFDVSVPDHPRLRATVSGISQGRQLAVLPGLAVISARSSGLWFVDVRDPDHPKLLPRGDTLELATGLAAAGRYAFVGNRVYGIEIIDIADPANPVYLSRLKTSEAQSVVFDHGRLYAGDWAAGKVTIIDVADPRHPVRLGEAVLSGFGDGLAVRGRLLFAATGHHRTTGPKETRIGRGHGLEIFDVSDPARPVRLSRVEFPPLYSRGNDYWTVRESAGHAYVADSYNGLFVLDAADPRNPRPVAHAALPKYPVTEFTFDGRKQKRDLPDACTGVAIGDGVAYITGMRSGLSLVKLPGVAVPCAYRAGAAPELPPPGKAETDPRFFAFAPGGQFRSAAVDGDCVWAGASRGGLHLVKLSERGIEPVRHWPIAWCYDARRSGDLLVTAEGDDGVGVYRITPELDLVKLGMAKGMNAQRIWLAKGCRFALTTAHGGAVYFVDLADPAKPQMVLRHVQPGMVYSDLVSHELFGGRYLLQNWHVGGFAWYDVSGDKPVVAQSTFKSAGAGKLTSGVASYRGRAFVFTTGRRFVLAEPNQPPPVDRWPTYAFPAPGVGMPRFDGDILAVSSRSRGTVALFEMRSPTDIRPLPERTYQLSGCPETVDFWCHRLVIPAGYQGLLLEK